jgi:hypothetical protein
MSSLSSFAIKSYRAKVIVLYLRTRLPKLRAQFTKVDMQGSKDQAELYFKLKLEPVIDLETVTPANLVASLTSVGVDLLVLDMHVGALFLMLVF